MLERLIPRAALPKHPLVRRHLVGKPHPPIDTARLFIIVRIQIAFVVLSLVFNILGEGLNVATIPATAILLPQVVFAFVQGVGAVLFLPVVFLLYGYILFTMNRLTATMVINERQQHTLPVLRTIPASLREIFLSQIAAAAWQQTELIDRVLWSAALLSLPPVAIQYAALWPPISNPFLPRLGMVVALCVALLRPVVEIPMAGAFGILAAAYSSSRITSITGGALLLATYFVLINLPRLLALSVPARLLLELVLPLSLPPLLIWIALVTAEKALAAD